MLRALVLLAVLMWFAGCAPWRGDARTWAPEQAEISAELERQARPIGRGDTIEVESLWAMTRTARIIGIGEGTHGTHEFRQLMNAMVMRAAADERPLVVALELGFVEGLRLDAWVRQGTFPPEPSIRAQSFEAVVGKDWLYATDEFRALFVAIRGFNARAAPGREIRVVGVDVCLHAACAAQLRRYLAALEPAEGERLMRALAASSGERDRVMADMVEWVARERPDARIVLLAHNGHITRGRYRLPNGRMTRGAIMGEALAGRFGAEYVAVQTSFGAGTFLAHHTRSTLGTRQIRAGRLRVFTAEPARPGTLEATLRGGGAGYALDVRSAAVGDGRLARYLRSWHWTRSYGYAWKRVFAAVPVAWEQVRPIDGFDVWVYFARGSATRPYGAGR